MTLETIQSVLETLGDYEAGNLSGPDLVETLIEDVGLPDELEAQAQAYLVEYKLWLSDLNTGGHAGHDPDPLLDAFVEALEKAIQPTDEQFRLAARRKHEEEGVLEFDDTPQVSKAEGEHGAYVQAWVWVDIEEAHEHGTKGGDV